MAIFSRLQPVPSRPGVPSSARQEGALSLKRCVFIHRPPDIGDELPVPIHQGNSRMAQEEDKNDYQDNAI